MAGADLDTLNSTQLEGVKNLGLIYQALLNGGLNLTAVPATSASAGNAGQVAASAAFLYICVGPSTWRRVALSTF
jgi:hypothetical protein